MDKTNKICIFLSHAHKDNKENTVEKFISKMHDLIENDEISIEFDGEINLGDDIRDKIKEKMENSDIICLFISFNYLESSNCMKEKEKAIKLKKNKNTIVIPIILSSCDWKSEDDLTKCLVGPENADPIFSHSDPNIAWDYVSKQIKKVIIIEKLIRGLEISEDFNKFLKNAEMLERAHDSKTKVYLDDIFVFPDLISFESENMDENKKETMNSKLLIENILDYSKILISGDNQSGKTSLAKMFFKTLKSKNFVPVYINNYKDNYKQDFEKILKKSFNWQYKDITITKISKKRIVPIIDDFHHIINKERIIKELSNYSKSIIFVDELFNINVEDESLLVEFENFTIKEFRYSLRHELIKKWLTLTDKYQSYADIDKNINVLETILGKNIGTGLMPIYPFFILSAIVNYNTFRALDEEITSQGYYYQIFIHFYLKKQGVVIEEYDIYLNFLSEISFHFFNDRKEMITSQEFEIFIRNYSNKFFLPIKKDILIKNMRFIFSPDNFKDYSFNQKYFYFFFVAKYLADNIQKKEIQDIIEKMMENLHVTEYAYITIFLSHHTKNDIVLNTIKKVSRELFKNYEPATLKKSELAFIDKEIDDLIDITLSSKPNPKAERKRRNKAYDEIELSKEKDDYDDNEDNPLGKEMRRAVKTVEVMGAILKNRKGSLELEDMEYLFREGTNIHLRILSSFFDAIKEKDHMITSLSRTLKRNINKEGGEENLTDEKIRKLAEVVLLTTSFLIVNLILRKIIHSIGSKQLALIGNNVYEENPTPANYLVKEGIWLWFDKSVNENGIKKRLKKNDFSLIGEKSMYFMIIDHCSMHEFKEREIKRIEDKLGIKIYKRTGKSND
ncbi:MAG: TIR domain-containing protein [Methanobrevibacter sp.]|nr:TIR domain-containing protein [Methanobrevibacter sp.]